MSKCYFIIEDNPDMSISKLIKANKFNGDSFIFSSGNNNLFGTLSTIYNTDDRFYIFYDLSPDNNVLISKYSVLINQIENEISNFNDNVWVIPIICTEYIVLKMLLTYKYINEDLSYAINNIDYKRLKIEYKQRYMERCYKQILKSLDNQFHNINESSNHNINNEGAFYRTDNTDLKSERICFSYPIMNIVSDDHKEYLSSINMNISKKDLEQLKQEINTFYDNLFDAVNKSRKLFRITCKSK